MSGAPDISAWQVALVWIVAIGFGGLAAHALLWASAREAEREAEKEQRKDWTSVRLPRRAREIDCLDD